MSEHETTRLCARIVGPFMVIVAAVIIARADDLVLLIPAIVQDGPLAFITGIFTLMVGLILFAAHHHWSSAPAILISVLAILTVIRGVTLMFAPSVLAGLASQFLQLGPAVLVTGIIVLLVGAWLAFVGFRNRAAELPR